MDRTCVGAGGTWVAFELVGNLVLLCSLDEHFVDDGVDVGAAADYWATSEFGGAEFAFVAVGVVGAVANVHGYGEVGMDAVGGYQGTSDADFFLSGSDGYNLGFELVFLFREAEERLAYDVGSGFIVEGTGGTDGSVDDFKFVIVGGDVAYFDAVVGVGFVAGGDVYPHAMDGRGFLAVLGIHEVDGTFASDSLYWAVGGLDDNAASGNDNAVVTAYGIEVKKAFVVDVGNNEAEFVEVA